MLPDQQEVYTAAVAVLVMMTQTELAALDVLELSESYGVLVEVIQARTLEIFNIV
jgi:hypothetical protein